jgi:hypothetical protein
MAVARRSPPRSHLSVLSATGALQRTRECSRSGLHAAPPPAPDKQRQCAPEHIASVARLGPAGRELVEHQRRHGRSARHNAHRRRQPAVGQGGPGLARVDRALAARLQSPACETKARGECAHVPRRAPAPLCHPWRSARESRRPSAQSGARGRSQLRRCRLRPVPRRDKARRRQATRSHTDGHKSEQLACFGLRGGAPRTVREGWERPRRGERTCLSVLRWLERAARMSAWATEAGMEAARPPGASWSEPELRTPADEPRRSLSLRFAPTTGVGQRSPRHLQQRPHALVAPRLLPAQSCRARDNRLPPTSTCDDSRKRTRTPLR